MVTPLIYISFADDNFDEFWTGLVFPDHHHNCDNNQCINKLSWDSDGSPLDNWDYTSHDIDGDDPCLRYENHKMNGKNCRETNYYICEVQCPAVPTTTTTTVPTTASGKYYQPQWMVATKQRLNYNIDLHSYEPNILQWIKVLDKSYIPTSCKICNQS